jgi:solute carrier family 8 (sodium/calcium exchanger)
VHTTDFIHTEGKLKFSHGEAAKSISVPIVDTDKEEDVFNSFTVVLKNPDGGAVLTANKVATVTICHDDQFTGMINSVVSLMKLKRRTLKYSTGSWSEQFENAIRMSGDVDEDGMPLEPSALDFVMHFLTIGWKVLFAFVPPTEYCGGWLAFVCAIAFIGILTGLVGELAALFGCVAGLKTSVTAITIVALGTSLPDTFASMTAAKQDRYADAAVGNVTGSNSVNVFLGMGLPWVLAVSLKGGDYHVPKGDLVFSVLVFTACACVCFSLLLFRRWTVGGELGGPWFVKIVSSLICFGLWLVYLVASIGKAYGQW